MEFVALQGSKPITSKDIEELDKRLHFKIDSSYSDFLLKHNCVSPKFKYYKSRNAKENWFVRFKLFLGINEEKLIFDIYSAYLNIKDRIPDGLFPIAETGGENVICMGYKGENKGKIFYCALGDVVNKVSYEDGTVSKIADSLDEVLNNLVESPE